ncbi:hypothetical protein [Paenibacillus ehimensis]|uniref:hypothetical protein n=2 Tax=Paenibacillus ehimensis TaxID=79264 RepID=UPI001FE977D3|nr:hypothetical protein [Paenibacillus ehimensis]
MVSDLLQRSGSKVSVKLKKHFPGGRLVGGKYQMASHTVTLYEEEIKRQCSRLFGSLDRLEEYTAVIFAHELGHAEDPQLEDLSLLLDGELTIQERNWTALQIEENAWRYAEKLLADMDQAFLAKIITESLAAYREKVAGDIA